MNTIPKELLTVISQYLTGPEFIYFSNSNRYIRSHLRVTGPSVHHRVNVNVVQVLDSVFNGAPFILIHGAGGCGKSYCVKKIYEVCNRRNRPILITATTGMASLNIPCGMTVHKAFAMRGNTTLEKLQENFSKWRPETIRRKYLHLIQLRTLIIDEISMMTSSLMECVDYILRTVHNTDALFGGIQVIMTGDFLQLPPVCSKFIFTTPLWQRMMPNMTIVNFETPYRQKTDLKFFGTLTRMRYGQHTERDIRELETRSIEEIPPSLMDRVGHSIIPPILSAKHSMIEEVNQEYFDKLPATPELVFNANDTYVQRVVRDSVSYFEPYHGMVDLKKGAIDYMNYKQPTQIRIRNNMQCIVTMNHPSFHEIKNGSIWLTHIDTRGLDGPHVYLVSSSGGSSGGSSSTKRYAISHLHSTHLYCVDAMNQIYVKRVQLTMRIGYAITIHSSQGITLPHAILMMDTIFGNGQAYVALSRVSRLKDLYIMGFDESKLSQVNTAAIEYVCGTILNKPELLAKSAKPPKKKRPRRSLPPESNAESPSLF